MSISVKSLFGEWRTISKEMAFNWALNSLSVGNTLAAYNNLKNRIKGISLDNLLEDSGYKVELYNLESTGKLTARLIKV